MWYLSEVINSNISVSLEDAVICVIGVVKERERENEKFDVGGCFIEEVSFELVIEKQVGFGWRKGMCKIFWVQ